MARLKVTYIDRAKEEEQTISDEEFDYLKGQVNVLPTKYLKKLLSADQLKQLAPQESEDIIKQISNQLDKKNKELQTKNQIIKDNEKKIMDLEETQSLSEEKRAREISKDIERKLEDTLKTDRKNKTAQDKLDTLHKQNLIYILKDLAAKQGVNINQRNLEEIVYDLWDRWAVINQNPYEMIPKDLANWDWRKDPRDRTYPPKPTSANVNRLIAQRDAKINQLTRQIEDAKPEAQAALNKALSNQIDDERKAKRELQTINQKLSQELAESQRKQTVTVEKIVEKIVYRDTPKQPTDPTARPPQTPKTPTTPRPQTQRKRDELLKIEDKGIWTNKLLQELLDVYDDILIRAGVSLKNKIASFNIAIRRMMEDPLNFSDKVIIEDEITRIANDVALANSRVLSGIKRSLEKATGKQEIAPPTKGDRIKTGSDFGRDEEAGPNDTALNFGYSEPVRDRKAGMFPRRLSTTEIQRFYDAYLASVPHASEAKFDKWFGWETWKSFEAAKIGLADIIAILSQEQEEEPITWSDENDVKHYVNRDLVYTGVGGLVGGTYYAEGESEDEKIIRVIWQRKANKRPYFAVDIASVTNLPLTSIEKAILNAYYANKDSAEKHPGEPLPFYLLKDYTKDDYEMILNRNIPDKKTNGNATL